MHLSMLLFYFFFNDTATTEIYTLSLHDALPIFKQLQGKHPSVSEKYDYLYSEKELEEIARTAAAMNGKDRKSTRLNSSHSSISYAVFCLKKKKKIKKKSSIHKLNKDK